MTERVKHTDVSIDIETLGSKDNLVPIIQVAALAFTPGSSAPPVGAVWAIDEQSQTVTHKIPVEESTLDWWEKKNAKLLEAILTDPKRIQPENLLERLTAFFDRNVASQASVWAKSPSFDLVKIHTMLKRVHGADIALPWRFTQERCIRTIIGEMYLDEHPVTPFEPKGAYANLSGPHDALYDATVQANVVEEFRKLIRVFDP